MATLAHDLRYAVRVLRKNPGFATVALSVLALGIGANTAIFTVVNSVLLRPLPFPDSERLAAVWEDASTVGFPQNTPAPANFMDWKLQNHVFADMAAIRNGAASLTGAGEPELMLSAQVTPNLFAVLKVKPAMGRVFTAEDDRPGAPKTVVLTHSLWVRRFASDPAAVGRTVSLNDEKYTVIGVMPAGFSFPRGETQLYTPMGFDGKAWAQRGNHFLEVIGRLKPGITRERARSDMKTIASRLERDYPDTNKDIGVTVVPLQEQYTGPVRTALWVLLAAVGLVLLIACANIANLLLARAAARSREMAVRAAIGAGRGQIIRHLLAESSVLAVGGAVAGAVLAAVSLRFLGRLIPPDLAGNVALALDARVLLFTALLAMGAAVLFGLAPAVSASRVDLHEALKQGGRGVAGRRSRLRDALVISEVALALVLLTGSGLLIQSLSRLRSVNLGFRADNAISFGTRLSPVRYKKDADRVAFTDRVIERVRAIPGVVAAAYTSDLPLMMKGNTYSFIREGYPPPAPGEYLDSNYREVTHGYLQTMGVRLLRGRYLSPSDGPETKPVIVINETMARQYWPGRDALGSRLKLGGFDSPSKWREIVGIVADVHQMGIDVPPRAEMYFPVTQVEAPEPNFLVIRSAGDPSALIPAVTKLIHSVDPEQPVSNVQTLGAIVDHELEQKDMQTVVLGAFAALAVALAAIGIYGVMAYSVTQRTAEIGVRMALGARAADVLRLIAGRGLGLALAGIVIGAAGALALTRAMAGILFGVKADDPATYAAVCAILLAVAITASLVPAIRAARLDPVRALRDE